MKLSRGSLARMFHTNGFILWLSGIGMKTLKMIIKPGFILVRYQLCYIYIHTWPYVAAYMSMYGHILPYERRQILPLYRADIIPNTIENANLMARKEGQYFSIFLLKLGWPGLSWPARSVLAGPGPAGPGLWLGLSMRIGADLHENLFLIEKRCFRTSLIIFEPSRSQNGSGSKFYTRK